MESPLISIIIAEYNGKDKLKYTLQNFAFQSFKNFEIIIADDGSKQKYDDIVKRYIPYFHHPVSKVWHEDTGFRKDRILNRAIFRSKTDKIIIIDNDCIPHYRFVENHYKKLEQREVLNVGRRVFIDPSILKKFKEDELIHFNFFSY